MASKSILVFVALFLLIARMGSSIELFDDVQSAEMHRHHHHAIAPVVAPANAPTHAPKKGHIHAPAKAPLHAPKKGNIHAPAKAPVHAPRTGPLISAPAKSPVYYAPKTPISLPHGCVAMCELYCRPISPKRPCMRTCTPCCAKFKCVPGFTNKCNNWGKVTIHENLVKCP